MLSKPCDIFVDMWKAIKRWYLVWTFVHAQTLALAFPMHEKYPTLQEKNERSSLSHTTGDSAQGLCDRCPQKYPNKTITLFLRPRGSGGIINPRGSRIIYRRFIGTLIYPLLTMLSLVLSAIVAMLSATLMHGGPFAWSSITTCARSSLPFPLPQTFSPDRIESSKQSESFIVANNSFSDFLQRCHVVALSSVEVVFCSHQKKVSASLSNQ